MNSFWWDERVGLPELLRIDGTIHLEGPDPDRPGRPLPPYREPPCTGCKHTERCRKEELACSVFYLWTTKGRASDALRIPSKRLFALLFSGG